MTFIVRQIAVTADGREIIRSNPFEDDQIVIGRNAENAIHLPDLAVHPEHATITKRDDGHIMVKSITGQSFSLDGRTRVDVTIDPAKGAELGFGGHVISVSEDEEGTIFTVKRVEVLGRFRKKHARKGRFIRSRAYYRAKGWAPGVLSGLCWRRS